jgi:hypothetical protein
MGTENLVDVAARPDGRRQCTACETPGLLIVRDAGWWHAECWDVEALWRRRRRWARRMRRWEAKGQLRLW